MNFRFMHERLGGMNALSDIIDNNPIDGPMVYPFLSDDEHLRDRLLAEKVYVATYWNEVLDRVDRESMEWKMTRYMVPLPIDQRYDETDMEKVLGLI
jgi:hypothetical protein